MPALQILHQNSLKVFDSLSQKTIKDLRNFYHFKKKIRLLITFLLLLPAMAFCQEDQKLKSVIYDAHEGTITIMILRRSHQPKDSEFSNLMNTKLFYSTNGINENGPFYVIDEQRANQNKLNFTLESLPETANDQNNWSYIYDKIVIYLNNDVPNISYIRLISKVSVRGNHDYDINQKLDVSTKAITPINTPTYQFLSNGKTRIAYSKQNFNAVDSLSHIELFEQSGSSFGKLNPIIPMSGYIDRDAPFSAKQNTYHFTQWAYAGPDIPYLGIFFNNIKYARETLSSDPLTIPAFTLPTSASATYDTTTQKVKFEWSIPPVTDANRVNDKFKIQYGTQYDFSDATNLSYAYDAAQPNYSILLKDNLAPQLYFRVARDHEGFGWELAKTTILSINIDSIHTNTLKDTLQNNAAVLNWYPLKSAWVPGASFVINKMNNTSGTQTTTTLTYTDFLKGTYTDNQIAVCNKYSYTLQILPPANSAFATPALLTMPGSILLTQIGTINSLNVSKGYFPDRTDLSWSSQGTFDNFIVKRAVYGSANYIQVAVVTGGSAGDYQADDTKGTPGVYYTYTVTGTIKCNNTAVNSTALSGIGFRSPTGNIYGKVTYENGQAVQNVGVRLASNNAGLMGKSILLDGSRNSYLKIDSLNTPFADSAFTFEAWIKPTDLSPRNQVLFNSDNQYEFGFDGNGALYFLNGPNVVSGVYKNINQSFVHVAGIRTKDSILIMLNDSVIARNAATVITHSNTQQGVYLGINKRHNNYKGFIDETRVWNIAKTPAIIARDYTRLLTGNETGLVAYWRFDETIKNQFYDLSHVDDNYNQNDGNMDSISVKRSDIIPTPDQLSLNGLTDSTGNYFISGIPFTGNGVTYSVVPILGTHQFDPASVNRLISTTSSAFTVDFKDKSSFAVKGKIYYKNSTVPVGGVQFKIDGHYAQSSDGTIIQTDGNGIFQISVPVGVHEVQCLKSGHVFVNDGKITNIDGSKLNYQGPVSERFLLDSTTIRFIGRVVGGAVQDAYPLGHSLSKNNLGKSPFITLELPTGTKYELYSGTVTNTTATVYNQHFLPSNQANSNKVHYSKVVYNKNNILIYPDSITGEFMANLIPEVFLALHVNITGWGDILDNKPVSLDFTNKFSIQNSIHNYQDSTLTTNGYIYNNYADSVVYNYSYQFIKRVTPTINMVQNNNGTEVPYFGDITYNAVSATGEQSSITLVDITKPVPDMYLFGSPVFNQNNTYNFTAKAYEVYNFFDKEDKNGKGSVRLINGTDNVPTQDGIVNITNSLKDGPVGVDTFSLNKLGVGSYTFVAGKPDIAAKGLKHFSAYIKFGAAENINFPQMTAYVLGGILTGDNFVTAGPNQLTMILRDPPGSASYSYAQQGSVISSSSTHTAKVDQQADYNGIFSVGITSITFVGVGVAVGSKTELINTADFGIHHEEHWSTSNTNQTTTTLTTNFYTSGDPAFVGAPADVFVGNSTNITYGISKNIAIIKRTGLNATDIIIYPTDNSGSNVIVQRSGINVGQTFGTLFAYPQTHIENVLIPNLVSIINTVLLPPSTNATAAQLLANSSHQEVYVSKLPIGNANYGKSNLDIGSFGNDVKLFKFGNGPSYTIYFPSGIKYVTDTISTLNQYIKSWINLMSDNEKAKLDATLFNNYSFHAGSPINYSEQTSISNSTEKEFSFTVSGSYLDTYGFAFNGFGFTLAIKESLGGGGTNTSSSSAGTNNTFGFSLGSNGSDDYFSVDVKKAQDNSFVFLTKGGVSGCPYEGATFTKYYQPGTVLNQPTMRIEVPKMSVGNPVVNDIPETRKASFNLSLSNASEAQLSGTYVLSYADNDSIRGATISIDGTPIGGGGRTIVVPFGETVHKVLTIAKGDSMNYNNVQIILKSSCQNDIADTVLVSAHFIPACSDIHIKSPANNWVINTNSPSLNGKRYLPISIDQFDVNNSLFDHIELQYKPAASSGWITAMQFFADSTKKNNAKGSTMLIANNQLISYNLFMDDAAFNDQNYNIQAVSICKLGAAKFVTTESNMVNGLKDTYFPRLYGSPQPANGVLGISDNIMLKFNETIAAGLLTYTDFQVTGIRNGVQGDHTVSVKLDGNSNYLQTEFNKNLTGKSTTTEMWILPDNAANGTLFSQGTAIESMELALTSDNYLQVTLGSKQIKSDKPVIYKPGEWAHVAMEYNAADQTVSAFYNYAEVIHAVQVDQYTGNGVYQFGRSISRQGNLFAGKIHRAAIWSQALPAKTLQINSLLQLSGAENNLLGFYPMDEGKGTVCRDKAHGSNATLTGTWSTPAGKAIQLSGAGYVQLNTSSSPVTSSMDYSMELWFKGDPNQSDAALASNGRGDNTDAGKSKDNFFLGFENKLLTFQNNGFKIQASGNYLDNNWHQVALAINRNSGIAQLYADGIMKVSFDAKNLGGIAAASTYLGVRAWNDTNAITNTVFDRYFTGSIDEFRIWNTYLNQTLINKNNNVRLQGDEIGLIDYYPFETYVSFQNNQQLIFSLKDLKTQSDPAVIVPDAVVVNAVQTDDMAPIKDHGPVDNLQFDFVVNNDGLIVNMLEPKQAIDKTIITIKVKNVQDLNGNTIVSPITWTAYIDQNQLKWSDNSLNLSKAIGAPMQFESYVVNSGGSIQNYRLSNLPGWLTADVPSGTVPPLGKQKITFTINPGLNIGTYDEVVFMTNDNNVTESLTLNMVVKGKKPSWSVNPADYSLSMNLYGKLRINNLFSLDKEDMLAAFVNGKCVGVVNNTYNAAADLWFTYLTIYGNANQGNNIVFRIWQASSGKVFQATPSAPVQFGQDVIIASIRNPIIFDGSEIIFQDIVLNKGWNWTSFNVKNNSTTIDSALVNGNWAGGDIIKNQTNNFNQYSAGLSRWSGSLQGVNNTSLFMLKTDNPQTLSISGQAVDVTKTSIPLKNNWNYISYLPQVNMSIKEALADYAAQNEEVIKSQDGFSMYDDRLGWIGNLTFMEPGKGYMLYRNQLKDTSFHYPKVKGFFRYAPVQNYIPGGNLNLVQSPVTASVGFAQNMTVTAIAGSSFNLQAGDWVLAYSAGEVRARARLITNPVLQSTTLFFNISGDQELPVYFLVERNGAVIAQSQTEIMYGANLQVGTLAKPLVLNFNDVSGSLINVYPNPFTQKVFVNINVPVVGAELHIVKAGVYNELGELIIMLPDASFKSGLHQISWNGKKANGISCTHGIYFIRITIDGSTQIEKVIKY